MFNHTMMVIHMKEYCSQNLIQNFVLWKKPAQDVKASLIAGYVINAVFDQFNTEMKQRLLNSP